MPPLTRNHSRKSFTGIFILVVGEFRKNISALLSYEIVFKIIALFVLGPVLILVGAYFISFTGHSSVTNERLAAYFMSLPGLLSVLLWGVSNLSILFMEFAGLITIAYGSLLGGSVSARRALRNSFRNTTSIIGVAGAQFIIYTVVSLPFLASAAITYFALLTDYDISYYLAHKPPAFLSALFTGAMLLAGLLVVLAYFFMSWVLAVPVCLFERKILFEALRGSRRLVKGSFARITAIMAASLTLLFALTTIVALILGGLAYLLVDGVGQLFNRPVALAAVVLTADYLVMALISIVASPLLALVIAGLYYERHKELSIALPDPGLDLEEKPLKIPAHGKLAKSAPWILLGVICVSIGVVAMSLDKELKIEDKVQVTAHRGSSKKAPENTLSAIRQAIEDGADFAEIDVQETADGTIVLLHDSDLMRVGGVSKKIWETTYEELRTLDVGSWFSGRFAGERVPALADAIDAAKGKMSLNIELKYNGHDRRLAEKVVEIVERKGFGAHCIITSLDYEGLLKVRRLNPGLRTGAIIAKAVGDITSLDTDLVSVESKLATADLIKRTHGRNKEVHVWTVNDAKRMEYFIDLGVDNIITDHPDLLVKILNRRATIGYHERIIHKLRSWLR